jgi:hypothetical protein
MRLILFYATAGITLFALVPARGAEYGWQTNVPSHCAVNERVVFTCEVKRKVVSVCASTVLNESEGYMQYRFGRNGKVEKQIPKKAEYKPTSVAYKSTTSNSGFASYLRFSQDGYRYYIFIGSEPGGPIWKQGKWEQANRDNASGINIYNGKRSVYYERCNLPADPKNFGEDIWKNGVIRLDEIEDLYPHDVAFAN